MFSYRKKFPEGGEVLFFLCLVKKLFGAKLQKKSVPARERFFFVAFRIYLRRRRVATSANAPKPASNPNAEGSGIV